MENYFKNMNTRVPGNLFSSLLMSVRNYPFISMDEEGLSKYLKESVDLKGIIFPHSILH